jgi:glycosyltransferase involved in cell wall biosynthesis
MNIYWITELDLNTKHKASRFELAEALRNRGHIVTLVIKREIRDKKINDNNLISLPTIPIPIISKFVFGMILFFYLPFILRDKKIDIIIIDGVHVWLPFVIPLKLLHIPLILDIRSTTTRESLDSILQDTSLFLSKYLVNGLTTITPELKDILIKKYKIEKNKIGIWSSGVSIKNFTSKSNMDNTMIQNIESKSFILMYHGSYSPHRGIENIISSLKNLDVDLRQKIELIFIGFSLKKNEELSIFCNQLGLNKQVRFIPQVPYEKMPSYISVCDVGIIPLPPEDEWCWESSPLKTLEYLAMGKPVIATNIPFHQRIFEKGECGVLIKNNEPESIANAIIYLYENRQRLDKMGKVGREIVENFYTWDKKALDLEKFIYTIL